MTRITLARMRNDAYNGMEGQLVVCSTPRRVGVELDNGAKISVRLECVVSDVLFDQCSICMDPLIDGTSKVNSCGHELHWWCMNEWRATAGIDFEAAGARCPMCRSYVGLASTTPNASALLDRPAKEIVLLALGAIHQDIARLNKRREPSFADELAAIMQQMLACEASGQAQRIYSNLQATIDEYKREPTQLKTKRLVDALGCALSVHCFHPGQTSDEHYPQAIRNWIRTTGLF